MPPHMAETTSDASLNQLVPLPNLPQSSIRQRKDRQQVNSVAEHRDADVSGTAHQTVLQNLRFSSRLFGASFFAARLPFVSADAGEDFSNNLFSDLAPILALFGEQVAKQYMSQSMSVVEDIIFACAPLGILTAIVGAIRVGGPRWMKAVIGRAREGKGVAEVELMSSTSSDVCELWNGLEVNRVLGSSTIIELYYLQPAALEDPGQGVPLLGRNQDDIGRNPDDRGIYDFRLAAFGRGTKLLKRVGPRHRDISAEIGPSDVVVPNIGLNIGSQRVSRLELGVVAVVGVALQLGVMVFAGAGVYLSTFKSKFEKDGQPVLKHAFPSMAAGTVALVIGMFLCCHIVEQSTTETTWSIIEPTGYRVKVAWLQKGGKVNDQNFGSYIISRADQKSSKHWNAMPEFVRNLLLGDTRFLIRTSHQNKSEHTTLTTIAVVISLGGFVAQFVGLRGLAWHVTIAQLVATGIMTFLRAVIRRNLVHNPESVRIESGYELEAMAKKIKGCHAWTVVTYSNERPPANQSIPTNEEKLARDVMDARRRLGALCRWPSQWQKVVDSVAEAIEVTMDFLWTNPDVRLKTNRPPETIKWELFVEAREEGKAQEESPAQGELNPVPASVLLTVSRKILPDGSWGPWKAIKNEIEAVLGLCMHQLKTTEEKSHEHSLDVGNNWREGEPAMGTTKALRIIAPNHPYVKEAYTAWNLPQTRLITVDDPEANSSLQYKNIVWKPSSANSAGWLAVQSVTSLEMICGQQIFSAFLSTVVNEALESVAGEVRIRGSEYWAKSSLRLRNTVLDELVDRVQRTELATAEDAFLSIVPPLRRKLPTNLGITEVFPAIAREISTYIEGGRFQLAELRLLWLFDAVEEKAKNLEVANKWRDTWELYLILFDINNGLKHEVYTSRTEEAMRLFCERFFLSSQESDTIPSPMLDIPQLIRELWGDSLKKRNDTDKWEANLKTWGDELKSKADSWAANSDSVDVNTIDSLRRTPLILASIAGNAALAAQLLRKKANPSLLDYRNRSALHCASLEGHHSVVHTLLLHGEPAKIIDIKDREGKSALDLAIERKAAAVVALLIFYGNDGSTLLHVAAACGYVSHVDSLITKFSAHKDTRTNDGTTALHLAAAGGHDSTIRLLVNELHANTDARTADGTMALHRAAAGGHDSTVQLLIQQFRADRDARTNDGTTALHLAAAGGHDSTIRLLVNEHHANTDARTADGTMALHLAAAGGHDSTIRLLVNEHHANTDVKTADGTMALHLAAAGGHDSTVQLLIQQFRADHDARTNDGTMTLHLAAAGGHGSTVQLLIHQFRAEHDARTNNGTTALHLAAAGGHDSTIQLLIQQFRADHNATTNDGTTALHLAAAGGHETTANLLINEFHVDKHARNNGYSTARDLLAKYILNSDGSDFFFFRYFRYLNVIEIRRIELELELFRELFLISRGERFYDLLLLLKEEIDIEYSE